MQSDKTNIQSDPGAAASTRVLLASERPAEWQSLLAPLTARGMRIETSDSAMAALAALQQAAQARDPFRIVMLAPMIQGMSAEILGAAIRNDGAHKDARLAILGEGVQEEQRYLQAGFHAWIHRAMPAQVAAAVIAGLGASVSSRDGPSAATPFAGRRILVADDDPVNRQVAASLLQKLGCITDVAADGLQAIEMHGRANYDLLLMDCDMPQFDGYQATQRIRAAEGEARRTPVVALSASMRETERDKCLAAGMDDFLAKPVRPQLLREVMTRLLLQESAVEVPGPAACADELEAVRDMFGADFAELASLYQNDSPPRLAGIREAHATGDTARMTKLAHALAGSSASIGATGMSGLCSELELRVRQGLLDDFQQRLGAIEDEYRRLRNRLQNMLD
jgi:CheY-like chemotaxis protein